MPTTRRRIGRNRRDEIELAVDFFGLPGLLDGVSTLADFMTENELREFFKRNQAEIERRFSERYPGRTPAFYDLERAGLAATWRGSDHANNHI